MVWKHTEENLILIGIGEFGTGSDTWPLPRKKGNGALGRF